MKEFVVMSVSGGIEIVLTHYNKPKEVWVSEKHYAEHVYKTSEPDCKEVLHSSFIEQVEIYFPCGEPNKIGVCVLQAGQILAAAKRIEELQATESFFELY